MFLVVYLFWGCLEHIFIPEGFLFVWCMILKVYSFHSWKIMRHLLSLFLVPDATPTLISHFSSVRGLFCWFQDFFPCLYFSKIWSLCSLACTYLDLSCLVFTKLLFFCMFVYFTKFQISEILTHFFFALCFQPYWLFFFFLILLGLQRYQC